MQRFAQIITVFALTFLTTALSAQSSASTNNSVLDLDLVSLNSSENWSFFVDEENKLYFIDFEKLSFNLSEIVVKNADNEVILKEDVLDLPVNTIFELDFSAYAPGSYHVELRSFTGMMQKSVVIN